MAQSQKVLAELNEFESEKSLQQQQTPAKYPENRDSDWSASSDKNDSEGRGETRKVQGGKSLNFSSADEEKEEEQEEEEEEEKDQGEDQGDQEDQEDASEGEQKSERSGTFESDLSLINAPMEIEREEKKQTDTSMWDEEPQNEPRTKNTGSRGQDSSGRRGSDDEPPKRGNRGENRNEEELPKRGNREAPQRGNRNRGDGGFRSNYEDNDYRRGGRGGGGRRGGYQNYNNDREGYRQNYDNDKAGRHYNDRGGRYDNEREGGGGKYYNNRTHDGPRNGNDNFRPNNYRGNDNYNRGNDHRGNDGNYGNYRNNDRPYRNKDGYDGRNNDNYNYHNNDFNQNNDYNNYNFKKQRVPHEEPFSQSSPSLLPVMAPVEPVVEKKEEKKKEEKKKKEKKEEKGEKKLEIMPRGQKCWPEVSMYVNEKKLSLCYRQVAEHIGDILIIPYKDLKFEIYPGNIVNKFKVNYRNKIESKGEEVKKIGYCYLQKCVGLDNFKAIGFLYVGESVKVANLKVCINGILESFREVNRQNKNQFRTIILPYSGYLGEMKEILELLINEMGKYEFLTEIIISTNNGSDFQRASMDFTNTISNLIDENKFSIAF